MANERCNGLFFVSYFRPLCLTQYTRTIHTKFKNIDGKTRKFSCTESNNLATAPPNMCLNVPLSKAQLKNIVIHNRWRTPHSKFKDCVFGAYSEYRALFSSAMLQTQHTQLVRSVLFEKTKHSLTYTHI